ncbi:MAG: electron transport complex subunit RsxC [Bacteroidales bacterium]|nr:electron transport complex subunit RsxC [Bacteroidales bacterium]
MLRTFHKGGIHPPESKLSAHKPIQVLPVPGTVAILLSQHMGAPAKVIVNKGDEVKTGQIIARGEGFLSGNIHSSVSGKVSRIEEVQDVSGYRRQAVFIDVAGDEWEDGINLDTNLDKEIRYDGPEILKRITEAGIVGMGGATFPTHVKLTVPRGKKAECLVINGVECEPYLTSDHALMLEKGEEIMVGIQLLKKALQVNKAYIGIENNKPDAIEKMRDLASALDGIEVFALQVKYPQGGEKQLIKAITGREVPSGGLPVDVGVVAFNVGTVFAVYEAVQKNKPLIDRIVTVTGKAVKNPSNFIARIGTSISDLIEAAGGMPENAGKVISGGPMMGKALSGTNIPVVKGTSGILILAEEESTRLKTQPCIRCAKCVTVCPMGLEPYLLMTLSERSLFDRLETEHVMDCIECGSCSYTCPASRPLLDFIRLGKSNVGKIIRTRKK